MKRYIIYSDLRRGEPRRLGELVVGDDGMVESLKGAKAINPEFVLDARREPFALLRKHYPYGFVEEGEQDDAADAR